MSDTDQILENTLEEPGTSRPMRKDAARNRELLITAGRDIFARRGLDASLDDIARQAGVGIGTAYRHFDNKFELADAIMQSVVDEILAAADLALSDADPWHGLVGLLEAILGVQTRDRGLREFMAGTRNPQKSDEVHERLSGPIGAIFDRAQQSGAVRADLAVSDLGCILAMLCEVADLAGDTAPDLWRRYFDILLAGLRPDGAPMPAQALTEEQFRVASQYHESRPLRTVK